MEKYKNLTIAEFIERAKKVQKNEYDYSKVKTNETYITIICKTHGEFSQSIYKHLHGRGCPKCGGSYHYDTDEYINKAIQVHGDRYDYSKTVYKNLKSPIILICKVHGEFQQMASNHLKGHGCPQCHYDKLSVLKAFTKEQFISKSKQVHNDKYDYSNAVYKNIKTPVAIICKKHNVFFQRPEVHLNGFGCPHCSESRGEKTIAKILSEHDILYEQQKTISGCIRKRHLKFDFHLTNTNIYIEFQGEQHYKPHFFFQGEEGLKQTQYNDQIKRDFCKNNNLRLIEIRYDESIKSVLKNNGII